MRSRTSTPRLPRQPGGQAVDPRMPPDQWIEVRRRPRAPYGLPGDVIVRAHAAEPTDQLDRDRGAGPTCPPPRAQWWGRTADRLLPARLTPPSAPPARPG